MNHKYFMHGGLFYNLAKSLIGHFHEKNGLRSYVLIEIIDEL